jgi:hypothetical protein
MRGSGCWSGESKRTKAKCSVKEEKQETVGSWNWSYSVKRTMKDSAFASLVHLLNLVL